MVFAKRGKVRRPPTGKSTVRARKSSRCGCRVAGLAQQAEVGICGLVQILGRNSSDSSQSIIERAPAGGPAPGLDDMADKVDAAIDRLQDGLRRIDPHRQGRHVFGDQHDRLQQIEGGLVDRRVGMEAHAEKSKPLKWVKG